MIRNSEPPTHYITKSSHQGGHSRVFAYRRHSHGGRDRRRVGARAGRRLGRCNDAKRTSALVVAVAITITALVPLFWPVTVAQAAAGLADAVFPPGVAVISLSIFGRAVFSRRIGRNEAFNHLGNTAIAIVAGVAGYLIAPVAVLWVVGPH